MIWLWRKFTLWEYGSDEDPPDIPLSGRLGSVALGLAVWAGYSILIAFVRG